MKRIAIMTALFLMAAAVRAEGRQVVCMNFGWRFQQGDIADGAMPATDDSRWAIVDLPHDFQIGQPWVEPDPSERPDNSDAGANIRSRLSSRGFKEMGCGWYRLHFTPEDRWKGRRVLVDFEGVMMTGDVYLNGERVGGTDYGYVGFELDVTRQLRWGEENVLAVRADTRQPQNSRWYTGGGLFRGINLLVTDAELYFERHPLRITTRDNRFVNITAEVTCRGRDKVMPLRVSIYGPDGNLVAQSVDTVRRLTPAKTIESTLQEIPVGEPLLWDCDHPNLYKAVLTLYDGNGQERDEVSERFGIRTIELSPEYGLRLNGQKVLLKGYANHHTLGALGAAAYPRAIEKRLRLLKQFGINHVRTSHNPYSRDFITLCDSLGLLVVDELYDKWTQQHTGGKASFESLWQGNVTEWVKRDRNSPSVVLWSLGNELQQDPNQPYNDFGVTMYRLMRTLVQRYDTTRLTTVAMHPRYRNWQTDSLPCDLALQTDIQAYNYRYMYFPMDGKRFPWMTFYQSEAAIASMGPNFFEMEQDKVIGLAYWGAIDYLGESQGWPAKGWANGVFDISLDAKPKAWLMKSMFKPEDPVVHIGVVDAKGDQMWNGVQTGTDGMSEHWNRKPGQKLQLVTYTNAEEVELFVNGHSLGTKRNPTDDPKRRNQIKWEGVEYQPGYVEAVAKNENSSGKKVVVARHRIETTGEAVRLLVEPDLKANDWKADGMDLQHVTVTAVDRKGRRVWTAQQQLDFQVEGDARIVAVANGDIRSEESYVGNSRRLWNGRATVILRAGQHPSRVVLKTHADGMKPVSTEIKVTK